MDNTMRTSIQKHYTSAGLFTYAGPYKAYFSELPDDVRTLGNLVCAQVIHRVTLKQGNTGANRDLAYGDMTRFPWYRLRCEDDVLLTAVAMAAELFRLDARGFMDDRAVEDKIVVTCRYVCVLMSAILKAKGIPCRSRSGFAPYCFSGRSVDHWINQYWNQGQQRWITFDADGFFDESELGFDAYDIPHDRFDWAAKVWLGIRSGTLDGQRFVYADNRGTCSLRAAIRAIFYDFHSLMNHEISYKFQPAYVDGKFERLTEAELCEIDELARLMLHCDENFDALVGVWNTKRKFRILNSPLIGDSDHLK